MPDSAYKMPSYEMISYCERSGLFMIRGSGIKSCVPHGAIQVVQLRIGKNYVKRHHSHA
jgi:hypothetical protein